MALKSQLQNPIRVSFGEMRYRPGLLLSLTDEDGNKGWGESWINFPEWGLEERTMVLSYLLRDVVDKEVHPQDVPNLFAKYLPQVIQSGGIGPYSQAFSAIECALWDLEAKRKGVPLFELLQRPGTAVRTKIPVYGSGIDPRDLERRITYALSAGFKDVKIKIGFDLQQDRANFKAAVKLVGAGKVMVDVNQGWDRPTAYCELAFYDEAGAAWVEEPISALDTDGYRMLTNTYQSIAAGENWYIPTLSAISSLHLSVVQPDLCKIGGLWAAQTMIENGPKGKSGVAFHVLGLPVSHAFALHAAAAWGQVVSKVEIDTNENPLSSAVNSSWSIEDGCARLSDAEGLGVEIDEEKMKMFVIPELGMFCTVSNPSIIY